MPKKLKLARIETCISLEQALGLARGQVTTLAFLGNGDIEVEFADSVNLPDAALNTKLAKAFAYEVRG